MFGAILASIMLSAPMSYQVRSFENEAVVDAPPTGQLSPEVTACVAGTITATYPGEQAANVVGVAYARSEFDRSQSCVTWSVERVVSVEEFVRLQRNPPYVRFPEGGMTVAYRDVLPRVCVPRGQLTALPLCLADYVETPGKVTRIDVSRDSPTDPMVLERAFEVVTGEPSDYAHDRRNGTALSHTTEIERPVEPVEPVEP
jgi:hypothetical protein